MPFSFHKGFTLIELLVVVLIIGILSAVALPQYEKAVAKSRAAEALVNLNTLVQAQQAFYMANGYYTTDLTLLDIEIPQGKNFTFSSTNGNSDGTAGTYYRGTASAAARYGIFFEFGYSSGGRWCAAKETNNTANTICAGYGTYDHSGQGYKYYKMN